MLPKGSRLTLPSDFYKVKKFGKRLSNKYFSISYLIDTTIEKSQFAVIVAKVVAKKSSQRNKLKRITKALLIKNSLNLPRSVKSLVYPKPVILSIKNKELEAEFLKLVSQIQ